MTAPARVEDVVGKRSLEGTTRAERAAMREAARAANRIHVARYRAKLAAEVRIDSARKLAAEMCNRRLGK